MPPTLTLIKGGLYGTAPPLYKKFGSEAQSPGKPQAPSPLEREKYEMECDPRFDEFRF
tara:strand:+ start:683 stop:856 length:174 start_codon:yes stop_codon:yes gene_type:complete